MDTLHIFSLLMFGLITCEDILDEASNPPSAPVAPYYPEDNSQYYPDYGYSSQPSLAESSFSSSLDRQGLETVLGAPLVITAFAAALLGGFLSPIISSGLSRLGEYEIMWPEVKRKIRPSEGEARDVESPSWIQALERVNQVLHNPITKV